MAKPYLTAVRFSVYASRSNTPTPQSASPACALSRARAGAFRVEMSVTRMMFEPRQRTLAAGNAVKRVSFHVIGEGMT